MKTRRIYLFGIPFDTVSESQALLKLHYYSQLPAGEQNICVTPNPEMIVEASRNRQFYDVLRKSDFSLADGTGLLWASGFLKIDTLNIATSFLKPFYLKSFFKGLGSLLKFTFNRANYTREIRSRVTGTDMFEQFLSTSQSKVFLLGGKPGAAAQLQQDQQSIVGVYDGMVSDETTPQIIEQVNAAGAEVLFIAIGSPRQELWIAQNLLKMPNIRFAMGVGGAFDFVSGIQKRAPSWMRSIGLEWLYRLVREPSRITRIWNATVRFFLITVREKGG